MVFGLDLSGRMAVVTGAGGILCGMFARTLAQAGASVALLDINLETAERTAREIRAYVRPDHGRMIWGETGRAGYGLYDRALGATYLNGLFEAVEKMSR